MQFELPHAYTVPTVAEKVKPLQQAHPLLEFHVLIFEILIALLEVANQMLLPC